MPPTSESIGRIFDQSLNEFFIISAKTFRFLYANQGGLKNLGFTIEELQGMSPLDISCEMEPDILQQLLAPLHSHEKESVRFETIHHRKDGSQYPVEIHVQLSNIDSTPAYIVMGLDIAERKNEEEALANLVAGTATVAAEQFFPQLVRHMASALNVPFAAVTELSGPNKVSALAVWHGNAPGEHLEYELLNTPCAQVLKGKSAIYSRNVQAQFPKDKDLQTLQAESYVGVALTNEQEEPLGHLFIIDTKPYLKTDRAISILKIFAARTSAELIRQKTELKNAQRESLLTLMLNTGPGCIKRVARDGTLLSMNPAGLTLIEAPTEEEALGLSVFDLVTPEHRLAFEQMHQKVLEGNPQTLQFKIEGLKGTQRWMETYATPFNNPITNHLEHLAVTHDITLRKTAESLIHDQKDTLERLARGEDLQSILEHICQMIEAQSQGLRCSILLLKGDTLWLGAAPSLPPTFSQKINGIKIGPQAGSCGTAAFKKETVIVTDIATDPLWKRGHRLALNHGLHACWSTPLFSSKGQLLGTFAMYYDLPKSPDPHDLDLVKSASNLAGIAIERRQNEQVLQSTMDRLDLAVKGSYDGLWEGRVLPGEPWQAPHTPVWWSPRFKELLGFQDHEFPNVLESWGTRLHPNDKDRIFAALHAHIEQQKPYDVEYRLLTKSNAYRWFSARGQAIWDDQGNLLRMAGSVRDITDQKEAEHTLQISEHSIRELYEITSDQHSIFDDKIRSILRLGCRRFGQPIGTLTKRIHENLQLEYLHDPNDTWTEQALVPICDSFCGITLERTTPLIFEDVGETEFINSSAYKALGLEAYIGTRVLVGNHVYGSLCFIDRTPHSGKYSSSDIHFLQLMARWIGGELERKQAEEALQEANERLRTLSQQLLTVQENERRQLARDLHDEIGQNLTAVKMNLHTLAQGKSAVQTHRIFQDNMQILDSMLKHVRELSLDLRPSLLDDLGLVAAVRWFVNRQAERAGWRAKITIDDNMPPIHPDQATVSFRIIQEALTNVMRHAQATHVTVQLQMKDHHFDLLIADNGIGFDSVKILEQSPSGPTLGLLSMQERVGFLNGNLSIASQRNQGTQIRAHIPVTALVKDATAS